MKSLVKIMFTLVLLFASTFIIAKATGLLSLETIEDWLSRASEISPWVIASLVVALLFADLFMAMPTLTIVLLAGFFLGPTLGAGAAFLGLSIAGAGGYALSRRFGVSVLQRLMKSPEQRRQALEAFQAHGFVTILLSRALPILPEVSACMAGLSGLSLRKFLLAWWLSTGPYVVIAAYAGSISSLENPMPAIYTAIGFSVFFWSGWFLFRRRQNLGRWTIL